MNWTAPYHGVSHYNQCPRRVLATIAQYGDSANAYVLHLASDHPFTPIREQWFVAPDSAVKARRWIEEQVGKMG